MSDNDDEQTKPDMTRIEDLSEYLHEEDPETDAQFDIPPTPDEDPEEEDNNFQTMSVDDLEDAPPSFSDDDTSDEEENEAPPSFESEDEEETSFSSDESTFGDDEEESSFGETDFEGDDFSSDSTQPDFETPAEFGSDDDDEEIEEVQEIEEESALAEEVENEIQEALSEDDSDNSFETDSDDNDDFSSDQFDTSETEEMSFQDEEPVEETPLEEEEAGTETLVAETVEEIISPEPESEPEPFVAQDPSPAPTAVKAQAQRENFKDVNDFGNAITYGQVAAGGNPPFSIILRKIKYLEDSERIIEILREHGLCNESNEEDYQQGLNNGSMLISQLSEYSAIYLAHKFRRFDLEILVGLADEIHPSKNYDMDYRGLVRKENLRQNKNETFSLEDQLVEVEAILLATTPTLENYRIDRYLGLVSTHVMIEETEFQKLQEADAMNSVVDPDEILKEIEEELAEEESSTAKIEIGLEEIYQNLAEALKVKAFKLRGNAVVGINYQITPLINQKTGDQTPSIRYKVSCTGNAVWVGGKEAPRSEA